MFRIESTPLTYPPYQCMVTGRDDGEIVVFDADVMPHFEEGEIPRVQMKREIIEEVARELGMASASEVDALREEVREFGEKVTAILDARTAVEELKVNFAEQLNS